MVRARSDTDRARQDHNKQTKKQETEIAASVRDQTKRLSNPCVHDHPCKFLKSMGSGGNPHPLAVSTAADVAVCCSVLQCVVVCCRKGCVSTLDGGGYSWPPSVVENEEFAVDHGTWKYFLNRDAFDLKFLILSANSLMVKMNWISILSDHNDTICTKQ